MCARGTVSGADWITNINYQHRPYVKGLGGPPSSGVIAAAPDADLGAIADSTAAYPQVHTGFANAALSVRREVLEAVTKVAVSSTVEVIRVSGHSLGGALATLLALELATDPNLRDVSGGNIPRVECFTFGAPCIGNGSFSALLAATPGLSFVRGNIISLPNLMFSA